MGMLETYHHIMTERADKRTNNWPLIASPVPLLLLTFAYLYFILRCGPRYMRDKQRYHLKTYTKCYNFFQVAVNFIAVQQIFDAGYFTEIGLIGCVPFKYSYEPNDIKLAGIAWWIMCVKILDYSETFVFILRKKNNQVSFLHVYHHVSTAWFVWVLTKYFAGGMTMTLLVVNSFVHVIMYTYYFLSCFGANVRRYISPIKPYITIVQMVQFWYLLFYTSQVYVFTCAMIPGAKVMGVFLMTNFFLNFMLFYRFYQKTYAPKQKK